MSELKFRFITYYAFIVSLIYIVLQISQITLISCIYISTLDYLEKKTIQIKICKTINENY